jgi:hypothetical protein
MAVIYGLVHITSGKTYVGCTGGRKTAKRKYNKTSESLLAKRFREHRCLLNANKHSEPQLQKDWLTDGEKAFKMEVLERLQEYPSASEKREAELRWMKKFEADGKLYNTYKESFGFKPEATKAGIEASRTAGRWRNGVPTDHGKKISDGKRRAKRARIWRQLKDIV